MALKEGLYTLIPLSLKFIPNKRRGRPQGRSHARCKMFDEIQSQTRRRRFSPPLLSVLADVTGAAPRAQLTATGGGPPPWWAPQRTLRREEFLIQDYFPQTRSQLD